MEKNVTRGEIIHGLKATGVLPAKAKMDLMGDMDEDVWCVKYEVDDSNTADGAREGFDWPPANCTEEDWAIPPPPEGVTLQKAHERVVKNLGAGSRCPCCGQTAKISRRDIYGTIVRWLVWLVREHTRTGYAAHVRDCPFAPLGGDYAKLKKWGLIRAPKEIEVPPDKTSHGYWIPTELAVLFLTGQIELPKKYGVYNDQIMWRTDAKAPIGEALKKEFSILRVRGEDEQRPEA